MGTKVQGHSARNQPHEGSGKRPSSSLHGRPGTTNRISIHRQSAALPLPTKFIMPQIETFNGIKDLIDHLNTYKNQMELHGYQDLVRCRAFAITLKGLALAWFNRLPPSSVSSFTELSIAFISHFIGARMYRKPSFHLLTIKHSSQESLRSYVQRFNTELLKVDILDEKFVVTAFITGLGVQSKDLMFSISKNS